MLRVWTTVLTVLVVVVARDKETVKDHTDVAFWGSFEAEQPHDGAASL